MHPFGNGRRNPHLPGASPDLLNLGEEASAPVSERAGSRFQDEVGDRMAPQVSPEAGAQPVTIYSSMNGDVRLI
jgi:hypothetical protein